MHLLEHGCNTSEALETLLKGMGDLGLHASLVERSLKKLQTCLAASGASNQGAPWLNNTFLSQHNVQPGQTRIDMNALRSAPKQSRCDESIGMLSVRLGLQLRL
eukprot:2178499-Amphidinium_carterae.1